MRRKLDALSVWVMLALVLTIVAVTTYQLKLTQEDSLNTLNGKIEQLNTQIEALTTLIQDLEHENNQLKEMNKALQSEVEALREENRALKLQLDALGVELRNVSQSVNMTLRAHEGEIEKLRFELYDVQQVFDRELEGVYYEIKALNKTIEEAIKPPFSDKEMYDGGAALIFDKNIAPLLINSEITVYRVKFGVSDLVYIAPPKEAIPKLEAFMNWTKIPQKKYIFDLYDCDNFAWSLYAEVKRHYPYLAFGVAFTKHHAFNIVILWDGGKPRLYIIEPQNGRIMSVEEAKQVEINGIKPYDEIVYIVM